MFMGFDRLTLILLVVIGAVVFQVLRKLCHGRAKDNGGTWELLPFKRQILSLFEGTPLGYLLVDGDGFIQQVNERECEILRLKRPELLGRPFWELAPEAERDSERESYFRALADATPHPVSRKKYRCPDGEVLTLEVYESILRDENGRVCGMSVASVDITERQRSEEAIFETTSELKAIFQAFPDYFLRLDERGVVVDSKAGTSAGEFGLPPSPAGKRLRDILPEAAAERIHSAMREVRQKEKMVVAGYDVDGPSERKSYEARVLPLNWTEVIVVLRNVTDRKQNEARLEEYAQELEEKNRELETTLVKAQEGTKLKSRFLANMSHEIRTPMNGVIGMTDFLLATRLDAEQQEYAESVKSSANSLLTILDDILDLSKIEAGKLQIESIPFDLDGTVEEVAKVFSLRARSKELEFLYEPAPKLSCLAVGDPGRLRQVLNNLLGNAIKFTREGSITLRTEVMRQTPEHISLRFLIEDTGIGISDEQRQRLFRNFAQGDDSMTRKYGGTGLGLAISKQLVELLGGQIGIRSEVGRGSVFWFTVTFGRQHAVALAGAEGDVVLEGLRVLIVDRNTSATRTVKRLLPSWGCRHETVHQCRQIAPKLQEAAARGKPFRVVFIDLELAEKEGFNARECVKSDPVIGKTLLVALTAAPVRGDGAEARQGGYAGYLPVPFRPSEFREMLVHVLRSETEPEPRLVTRHTLHEEGSTSRSESKAPQKPPETPGAGHAQPRGVISKLRALVAEDNLINQKIAARLLQKAGLDVDVVGDGRQAVEASLRTAYDLILMDCQMPEMDGFEATEAIRRQERDGRRTPICALTAHAMPSDREKCLAAGMDEYLSKPVSLKKLKEVLDELVHRRPRSEHDSTVAAQ